jgi:hypothetical protein
MGEKSNEGRVLVGKPDNGDRLEYPGTDGRIIFK